MFSSTFQGKFNFQGLFKTVLYIQVLFKPVRTLKESIHLRNEFNFCNVASHYIFKESVDFQIIVFMYISLT